MLSTVDGKRITAIPHRGTFDAVKAKLGTLRTEQIRKELDAIIDKRQPDKKTGLRTFNSSYLGSELSPWQFPISHLYHVAREIAGPDADEKTVQDQAALLFGLFVWECIMARNEEWVFWDANLNVRDLNREILGKQYFEKA